MLGLADLLVYPFFLVFARVGSAVMVFPAFSDTSVNPRTRLLIALALSALIFPIVENGMPLMPEQTALFLAYLFIEILIGLMFAFGARLFMMAINLAGELISFMSGFQAATLFDPQSGTSTSAPGLFLSVTVGVLIFATGLHMMMIKGLAESYIAFPPGTLPNLGDSALAAVKTVSDAFTVGTKIAAPVMAMGFLVYVMFGIFNRLIPQLQVFFVALPISIAMGVFMMAVALSAMLTVFMDELAEHLVLFAVQ